MVRYGVWFFYLADSNVSVPCCRQTYGVAVKGALSGQCAASGAELGCKAGGQGGIQKLGSLHMEGEAAEECVIHGSTLGRACDKNADSVQCEFVQSNVAISWKSEGFVPTVPEHALTAHAFNFIDAPTPSCLW